MATGVDFKGSNIVYSGKSVGDDVADLHVFANGAAIVSCWELSDEEIEEIVRTRRVFHSSFSGQTLYPVFVGSESVVRSVVVDYGAIW